VERLAPSRFLPVKPSIFRQTTVLGIGGIFFLSTLFLMPVALGSLAQILDWARRDSAKNARRDRGGFFLPR
jgi:hypothetical protein